MFMLVVFKGDFISTRFTNFLFSGFGEFVWSNGERYEGQFFDDYMSGAGVHYYSDGSHYSGSFSDNRRNGYGVLLFSDGRRFKGSYLDDQKHGHGLAFSPESNASLEYWEKGVLRASKALVLREDCQVVHESKKWLVSGASCVNGLAHGRGDIVSIDHEKLFHNALLVLGRLVEGKEISFLSVDLK